MGVPGWRKGLQRAFEEKLGPPDHNGCRRWTGAFFPQGYGKLYHEGKWLKAHRVAWFFHYGKWPERNACHNCPGGDNRWCCEWSHLFDGSQRDNAKDAAKKGRMASGAESGMRLHPERYWRNMPGAEEVQKRINAARRGRGSLSVDQVREIRSSTDPPSIQAPRHNTSVPTICNIRARRAYAWVED